MKKSIREQIEANKRGSFLFASLMVVLISALTSCIVGIAAPKYWQFGLLGGVGLSLLMVLIARASGPGIVLSISGAREATDEEHRMLQNVVEEMAIAAGIPAPKVYVIEDSAPNAFATGRDSNSGVVAITQGLLRKLDRDELQGVMAHEIAHIRNLDIRYMTTVSLMGGLIALLSDVLSTQLRWGAFSRRGRNRDNDGGSNPIFIVVGLLLAILAPLFGWLLQMAVSRQREFLADASAAEMTRYPEGLASALKKISYDPEPLEVANRATQHMYIVNPLQLSKEGNDLFSTHPSTEARIKALLGTSSFYEKERRLMPSAPIEPEN
jgi:heat shock protein HtpX